MDRISRFIIGIFTVSSLFVFILLVCRFYIQRDYTLKSEVSCNPATENCFVRLCTEGCEENTEPFYYKIRTVKAYELPLCDSDKEQCEELECSALSSCFEEFCSEDSVPEGEECNDSKAYRSLMESSFEGIEQGNEGTSEVGD